MPRHASRNWKKISGRSGLPKLRQSVMPRGRAPVQAMLRAASATVALPPSYGSSATSRLLQSTVTASPKPVPSTRSTPASPPGAMSVPPCTVESYCSNTQRLLAIEGSSSSASMAPERSALGRAVGRAARRAFAASDSSASGW